MLDQQWAPKSERVIQLLASCIRTAVRLRYAREISPEDSIDVARVHDLPSALRTIAEKMEVHQNLPDVHGFNLALAETKLTSEVNLGLGQIIAIRGASMSTIKSNQHNSSERQQLIAVLRSTQQKTRSWEKEYSRFLSEIEALYKSARTQIDGLRLARSERLKAQSELEQLIVETITKADNF